MKRFGKIFTCVFKGMFSFIGRSWLHFFCAVQILALSAVTGYWVKGRYFSEPIKKFDRATLPPSPVEVVTAARTTFEDKITLLGKVLGDKMVVLRPEIDGRVKSIAMKENAPVRKGDLLFLLEDAVYKAELAEAKAQLALAQAKMKRDKALAQRNAKAAKDVEEAEANVQVVLANVEKRKANLERTRIIAPFDGTVGMKQLSEGAWVRPGDELATVASPGLVLEFCVPEKYLESVSAGDPLWFGVDSSEGRQVQATVSHVDAHSHAQQHCVRCRAEVKNYNELPLRHGMYSRVQLVTRRNEDVIVLPQSAVETRGKISFVYIVNDEDRVEQKLVTIGSRSGDHIEILGGVSEGMRVVTAGQMKIQDGFPVYVLPPKCL